MQKFLLLVAAALTATSSYALSPEAAEGKTLAVKRAADRGDAEHALKDSNMLDRFCR